MLGDIKMSLAIAKVSDEPRANEVPSFAFYLMSESERSLARLAQIVEDKTMQ